MLATSKRVRQLEFELACEISRRQAVCDDLSNLYKRFNKLLKYLNLEEQTIYPGVVLVSTKPARRKGAR